MKHNAWLGIAIGATAFLGACGGGDYSASTAVSEKALDLEVSRARFTITELSVPGYEGSSASGINNKGQVVGVVTNTSADSSVVVFNVSGNGKKISYKLYGPRAVEKFNDKGEMIGPACLSTPCAGTFYPRDQMTGIPVALPFGFSEGHAWALNSLSQVAGWASGESARNVPVLFGKRGQKPELLKILPDSYGGWVSAINDKGQMVGRSLLDFGQIWRATQFRDNGRSAIDLGVLPNGYESVAWSINENGKAVGFTAFYNAPRWPRLVYRATMFNLNGDPPINLDTITSDPTKDGSVARHVNNKNQVIGDLFTVLEDGVSYKGSVFFWEKGVMQDLNSLIDPASGWRITRGNGINDDGEIAVTATHEARGITRALLLTPVKRRGRDD